MTPVRFFDRSLIRHALCKAQSLWETFACAEVAHRSTARADELGAGVSVPCVTAVGGAVDLVGSVGAAARSATVAAVFVHASDIHVACDQVTGDLDVADEGAAVGNLSLVGPGVAVISGVADKDIRVASEIVPGDIHSPVEGRGLRRF